MKCIISLVQCLIDIVIIFKNLGFLLERIRKQEGRAGKMKIPEKVSE